MSLSISTPDLLIAGIVFLSILIGIVRGFVKELISLVTWVFAICMAALYASPLSEHITFTKIALVKNLTSFLLIFVGIVFVGAIINYVIGGLIRKTPFSVPDRVLGSIFGVLRGGFFVTILILIAGLTPFPEEDWWNESYAIGKFEVLAIWIKDRLPDENAKVFHFSQESETGLVKKGS
jgi:membrane protein required for colicin V production